jgi:hypothetical protein
MLNTRKLTPDLVPSYSDTDGNHRWTNTPDIELWLPLMSVAKGGIQVSRFFQVFTSKVQKYFILCAQCGLLETTIPSIVIPT